MTKILIADDSPFIRESIRRLLRQRLGCEVWEAVDGEDAVEKVHLLRPDLVVLDFMMPRLNGLEAARQIARTAPEIPVLLCTIYVSRQLVDLARSAGVAGALAKSNLSQLTAGIEAILRGETFFLPLAG